MHHNICKLLVFFICTSILPGFPSLVFSQDKTIEKLDPIIVNATREVLSQKEMPTSVSVITREDIEEKKYINVEDMLREELGLDVLQNGSLGSSTSILMRGAGSSSTLVLVDGIQVNSNTLGSFNFAHIQSDNVERIEILRGPQSTLWGADAVGGVINIVTRRGKGAPSHYLSFEGGSFSTFKEVLGSSGEVENMDYSVTASRTDSEGFSSANEKNGNTENDRYQNTSFSMKTGYNFSAEGNRIEFIGQYIDARINFDRFVSGTGFTDGPPFTEQESVYLALPIYYSPASWWKIKLNPSLAYDSSKSRKQTSGDSNIFSRNYTIDLQNNFSFADHYSLLIGGEYQKRNGENVDRFDRDLDNKSAYLQGIFDYYGKIVLTAGLRHDVNDPFDDATTYKFEAAYSFDDFGTRIRGSYGTGFRAPTINDLFFPGFSNPNLKPEENTSWEVGFDQNLFKGAVTLSSVYFNSDFDNLIQFDLATFQPQNIAKATSNGVETTLKIRLPWNIQVSANHTWNEAFDDTTKARLRRRAEHKFHANIQHLWKNRFKSLVGITYKGDTEDGSQSIDSYVTVRAVLDYQVNKNLKLTVRGENLFDEEYEEVSGFGTAGISGYAGFIYKF